jgi:trk system potassium uptake protein TrkA
MSVIIVGAGVVGLQVARRLIDERKDVTIIEENEEAARYASSRLDCMVVTGQGNNLEILRKAGAERAEYFIALTGSDEINMICCSLVAAEFKVPNKVARVRNVEYLETRMTEQRYLGIDYIINPETEAAKTIIQQLDTGARNYVMVFENMDIHIQRILVDAESPFANKAVHQLPAILPLSFVVPVIQRDSDIIIPDGNSMILEGDEVYIAAKEEDVKRIYQILGEKDNQPKHILLVGGGSIGRLVLQHLLAGGTHAPGFLKRLTRMVRRKSNKSVRVVERDYAKCKLLSDQYPDALVINADISEENIFEEEGLDQCDLMITATENSEMNIVAGLYARKIGIDRAITLVRSENYAHIAEELGINVIVSLKNTVVNSILRYLLKGNISTIQTAGRGLIEFLELQVDPGSRIAGQSLKDLRLPPETLILYIHRGDRTFIPDGNSALQSGDHFIILARKEFVPRIEELVTYAGDSQ